MRALVLSIVAMAGVAAADPPKLVPKRAAITAFVPGMTEARARRQARVLGCADVTPAADQLDCVQGDEPALEAWTLWFEHGRLDRVEYTIAVNLDRLDASATRSARSLVDRRARELEAAADASGGARTRTRILSSITSGRRMGWAPTRERHSKLQLAVWDERGVQAEYNLWFEIVSPHAAFKANALFEEAR